MACRPQSNPTITSSDGVPPELAVLGFQRAPACTGQTGRRYRSDRSAQGFAGVDRYDDRSCVLAHSSVLARFCVNTTSSSVRSEASLRFSPSPFLPWLWILFLPISATWDHPTGLPEPSSKGSGTQKRSFLKFPLLRNLHEFQFHGAFSSISVL